MGHRLQTILSPPHETSSREGPRGVTPPSSACPPAPAPARPSQARADAHAMLSLIAEQGGGAEAALEDARRAAELAQAGGVVEQRAAAAERLAQLHAALGDTAAAEEQAALAAAAHAEAAEKAAKAAKEAREREEREKKESEDQLMAAVGGDEAAAEAPGIGDGDRD